MYTYFWIKEIALIKVIRTDHMLNLYTFKVRYTVNALVTKYTFSLYEIF